MKSRRKSTVAKSRRKSTVAKSRRKSKSRRKNIYDGSDMATSRQLLNAVIEEIGKKIGRRIEPVFTTRPNIVKINIRGDDWTLSIDAGDDDIYHDHKLVMINFQDDDMEEFYFHKPFIMTHGMYIVNKDIIKSFVDDFIRKYYSI